jgi:phosphatidylinositol-3-phosphatase
MRRSTSFLLLGLPALFFSGVNCSNGITNTPPDASTGTDAACEFGDSGSGVDSGSEIDSGIEVDSGSAIDSGTAPDAASGVDSGSGMDSGNVNVDSGTPPDAGSSVDAGSTGQHIKTVFIIMEENQNWADIQSNSGATYINGTLTSSTNPLAAYATDYHGATTDAGTGIHPSEPNYLWLEAGDNFGITADGTVQGDHTKVTGSPPHQHLVDLLESAGVTWKSYQENITAGVCAITDGNEYAAKHNPVVFFDDVNGYNAATGMFNSTFARCVEHVVPFTQLATDLQNNNVAQYNFITPDLCDDMHGGDSSCSNGCTSSFPLSSQCVPGGDAWLQANVPTITGSTAFKQGGALFIIWDESEPSFTQACGLSLTPDCPVGMIVLSPFGKTGPISGHFSHSSTLKTVEELFKVSPLLGGAADPSVNDLSPFFNQFP